ncbi:hypothetical protein BC629DRAFT_1526555 [Irpex lacteus]|nr:hypothetical protein BC629DRAFT_1526555 [Irpex lacteus]
MNDGATRVSLGVSTVCEDISDGKATHFLSLRKLMGPPVSSISVGFQTNQIGDILLDSLRAPRCRGNIVRALQVVFANGIVTKGGCCMV